MQNSPRIGILGPAFPTGVLRKRHWSTPMPLPPTILWGTPRWILDPPPGPEVDSGRGGARLWLETCCHPFAIGIASLVIDY